MKKITEEQMQSAKKVLADYEYQKTIETLFEKPDDYILENNIFHTKVRIMRRKEFIKLTGKDNDFIVINFRLNDFDFQEQIEVYPFSQHTIANTDDITKKEYRAKLDEIIIDAIVKRFSEHLKERLPIKVVKQ